MDRAHRRPRRRSRRSPVRNARHLGEDVPEPTSIRAQDRRHGLPAFVHDRLGRRRPGHPRRRLDDGCMFRCLYCHNPDTWTLSNGIPVTLEQGDRGGPQIPPRAEGHEGRLHLSGGEPLMQDRFAARCSPR
jgi:pyruvate formate lyase activating enzyme